VQISYPEPHDVVFGRVLYPLWSLDVFGEAYARVWKAHDRDYGACIRVVVAKADKGVKTDIVSSNYGAQLSVEQDELGPRLYECDLDPFPVLFGIPPGVYSLEIWLVDTSIPSHGHPGRLLTQTASVPFEMRSMDDKALELAPEKNLSAAAVVDERGRIEPPTDAERSTRIAGVLNSPPLLSPTWPRMASLKSRSKSVTAHEVIAAALKAEWSHNKDLREQGLKDTYGRQLSRVVEEPDCTNDWENVLRAAMHGRHLPILAALPTDTEWFKIEGGISTAELGSLKTLREDSWGRSADGATNTCATVRENFIGIWTTHCRGKHADSAATPRLVRADGNPTHSNQVLSMMSTAQNMSRILVAFGASWNESLTLWDGNHRAICFFAEAATRRLHENGLKWREDRSGHEGCYAIDHSGDDLRKLEPFTLFVGLSKAVNTKFMCHFSSLHEKQQLALIDGGPLVSEAHRVEMRGASFATAKRP
jgi:hypothetical protein